MYFYENVFAYILESPQKHITIDFYFVHNETTIMYNLLLSDFALRLYKYKVYCRLENIDETAGLISSNVKSSIFQHSEMPYVNGIVQMCVYFQFFQILFEQL